jgi:hypothetical protein
MEDDFTREELDRQDFVDNVIYAMVNALVPTSRNFMLEWDINWIAELREHVEDIISSRLLTIDDDEDKFSMEFYPYRNITEEIDEAYMGHYE